MFWFAVKVRRKKKKRSTAFLKVSVISLKVCIPLGGFQHSWNNFVKKKKKKTQYMQMLSSKAVWPSVLQKHTPLEWNASQHPAEVRELWLCVVSNDGKVDYKEAPVTGH